MEFLIDLWAPILVSAVLVWIASFLCHMVIPLHKGEWRQLPSEEQTLQSLQGATAGNYMFPWGTMADMKNPEFVERQKNGPNGTVIIWPGPVNMGRNLILTLLSYMLIGLFVAYIAWHALAGKPGSEYLEVFRIAGASAFLGHALGLIPHAIWYRGMRIWTVLVEGLIYALLTAGTFAWLFPR